MADFEKLNDEMLDAVTGGKKHIVNNPSSSFSYIRSGPAGKVIGKVRNGDDVYSVGRHKVKNGYDWYYVVYRDGEGWIAGSLIGY
ncbi:MAG: SH3 domain-containing protein [Lachnospiraceae bacterium]|nr:SH3 domain-containing protein [Lachnospiraceae bacterium]